MDVLRVREVCAGATVGVVLAVGLAGCGTEASPSGPRTPSASPAPVVPSENPPELEALAQAIGAEGRTTFADSYANLALDPPHHRVLVYVTSLDRGRQMVQAAAAATPALQVSDVVLVPARYTKRTMDAAMNTAMAPRYAQEYGIVTAAAAPDGSAVQVTTTSSAADSHSVAGRQWLAATSSALTAATLVTVTVSRGSMPVAVAGAAAATPRH